MPNTNATKQAASMRQVYARRWAALKVITGAIRDAGWTLVQFASAIETGAVKLPRKSKQTGKDVTK
jgi:hypothetical protein